MNEIQLHGGLRSEFGETFKVDIATPVEAYRALAVQLPGFRDAIRYGEFHLIREMPNSKFAIDEATFHLGMDNCRLHIIPAIGGAAKKGGAKLILGIAIIGASLFIPGGAALAGLSLQTMGIMAGAAIALGGLAMLLTPTPKFQTGENDNKDSFLFSGNVNPSGQNLAIPIGFGTFRVPHMPVASRLLINEVSSGDTPFYNPGSIPGVGGYRNPSFDNDEV